MSTALTSVLKTVEPGVAQQTLVTGQVVDAVTGSGVTPETFFLEMRSPGEAEYRVVQAYLRVGSGGYFSFSGIAHRVFPQDLNPAEELELRFNVAARFYAGLQTSVVVAASAVSAPLWPGELSDHEQELRLIPVPLVHLVLALEPTSVRINGLVISDHDLDSPVEGASIQVIAPVVQPAVLSNAQGRFRINAQPHAKSITLRVELGDTSTTINHIIDYSTSFNTLIISSNG